MLRRLVLKELADNALDEGAVKVGSAAGGGYFVEDDGPGFDGTPEAIARMFSINRPLVSTKLWRLPTRGAQGNGLRVVAGSVVASKGSLAVTTRGRRIELRPEHDGTTSVASVTPVANQVGTRVEIKFGPAIPHDESALAWARTAVAMNRGDTYQGKSSPFWYAADDFHALMRASDATVREMVLELEGCARNASEIVAEARSDPRGLQRHHPRASRHAADGGARLCASGQPEAAWCGRGRLFPGRAYATANGVPTLGEGPLRAVIPFAVEAWAASSTSMSSHRLHQPLARQRGHLCTSATSARSACSGAGWVTPSLKPRAGKHFAIDLNITTPFMPSTSDSKEPNLKPFLDAICEAVKKAVRKARNPNAQERVAEGCRPRQPR